MERWQRALVTGASSGIGEALAGHLAAGGTDVILVGRDAEALERVATSARMMGVDAVVLAADLATEAGMARAVSAIVDDGPMIDLLVNSAGLGQFGSFVDLPVAGALEVMRVNNEALVALTHAALSRMVPAGHGCVVQISSLASATPGPQQAVYAATKAFVSSFGQALSTELEGTGVTCTTVLPGFTRTRYFERIGLLADVPDKFWMTAEEVARVTFDAARRDIPLVTPGAINRRALMLATPFPSMTNRGVTRQLYQARHLAGRMKRRLLK
jgi:short-subunit dehydrogenase